MIRQIDYKVSQTYTDFYIKYLKQKLDFSQIKNWFDIGSGVGTFVNELSKMGIDAHGIEPKMSEVKQRITNRIQLGNFEESCPSDEKFDMISMCQVIYFLGDTFEVLQKTKKMLNSKGFIFVVTSNKSSKDHISKYPEHYKYLHTKEEYYAMCAKLNLKIIDYSEIQSNIGTAFNNGKIIAAFRMIQFEVGTKKSIKFQENGNFVFLILQNLD